MNMHPLHADGNQTQELWLPDQMYKNTGHCHASDTHRFHEKINALHCTEVDFEF